MHDTLLPLEGKRPGQRALIILMTYVVMDVPHDSQWVYNLLPELQNLPKAYLHRGRRSNLYHAREFAHLVKYGPAPKSKVLSCSTYDGAAYYGEHLNVPVIIPVNVVSFPPAWMIHVPSVFALLKKSTRNFEQELLEELKGCRLFLSRLSKEDEYIVPYTKGILSLT
jgi:hypothetical protein